MVFEALDEFARFWRFAAIGLVSIVEQELSVQLNERGAIRRNVEIHQCPDLDLAAPCLLDGAYRVCERHCASVDLLEQQTSISMAEERPLGVDRTSFVSKCRTRLIEEMAFVDHVDGNPEGAYTLSFRWVRNRDGRKQDAVAADPAGNAEFRAVIKGGDVSHLAQGTTWRPAYRAPPRELPAGPPSFRPAAPGTGSQGS